MDPIAALKSLILGGAHEGRNLKGPLSRGGTPARIGNPRKKQRGLLVNGRPRSRHAKAPGGGRINADPTGNRVYIGTPYDPEPECNWAELGAFGLTGIADAKPPRGSLAWQREVRDAQK